MACALVRTSSRLGIGLDTQLEELLPELRGTHAGSHTLLAHLSHRAGLQAHRELFRGLAQGQPFDAQRALREAANAATGEDAARDHPPLYSDLGYILLGCVLARLAGRDLDAAIAREIARPLRLSLGSARQWERTEPAFAERVAPTERVAWRGVRLAGRVHDHNAWALAGSGLAGHAGAFGTAEDVARFGAACLDALAGRSRWMSHQAFAPLVERRPGGTLRAGFDGKSASGSSAGTAFSSNSFGHLGFTGTSFWCDPDASIVVALLANRVALPGDNTRIRSLRPVLHDRIHRLATQLREASG